MAPADAYLDDAYASYWHTIEADGDDPAPIAIDERASPDTSLKVTDAYTEFSTMSEA